MGNIEPGSALSKPGSAFKGHMECSSKNTNLGTGDAAPLVEYIPSLREALRAIPGGKCNLTGVEAGRSEAQGFQSVWDM